jgi:hypothetical protein
VWKNKLASLQEDARLIEKMKQCSKGNLANVPPLFDRDTIFASPGESTSQQQEAPSSPPSNTYNQEEPSPSLNSPEIEISEMLEDTPQEEEEEEEEEDKEELALPDIDLSVLIEEVDENDDNAVRRALDLMLKQFGDSL